MAGFEHLDRSFDLGPVRLASRAVFVAEGYGLANPHGNLTDAAVDWLVEQARSGWGMVLLGVDAPGCPTLAGLTPETVEKLQHATRLVEVALAFHEPVSWGEAFERFRAAGIRVFEAPNPVAARPDGVAMGVRVQSPDGLETQPQADWLHLGPDHARRLELVGGTLRQPYGEELQGVPGKLPVPLMFSGRVKDAVAAERVLQYYPVDLVGIGRGAVAAPELLDRARQGEDWMPCTGCMACLAPARFPEVGCAVTPKDVALPYGGSSWDFVGGSAAALRLALELDARGHNVRVFLAGEPVGGSLRRRGRIPQQAESMEAAVYLRQELRRSGIEMSPDFPSQLDADFAVASFPPRLEPEPGWAVGEAWLSALDILVESLEDRGPFAVWGDTLLATEIAAFFTMTARPVTLVCEPSRLAADTHPAWARHYRPWLRERRVPVGLDVPAVATHVVAGRRAEPDPRMTAVREMRADVIEVPDAYEPFAQRDALEAAFREALQRFD